MVRSGAGSDERREGFCCVSTRVCSSFGTRRPSRDTASVSPPRPRTPQAHILQLTRSRPPAGAPNRHHTSCSPPYPNPSSRKENRAPLTPTVTARFAPRFSPVPAARRAATVRACTDRAPAPSLGAPGATSGGAAFCSPAAHGRRHPGRGRSDGEEGGAIVDAEDALLDALDEGKDVGHPRDEAAVGEPLAEAVAERRGAKAVRGDDAGTKTTIERREWTPQVPATRTCAAGRR